MNVKEIREWVTCVGTILVLPALAWAWFTIQQSIEIKNAALRQAITETYETQSAHAVDMHMLTDWTKTIQQGQTEQKLAIQHLTDVISIRRPDGVPRQSNQ